jgi:hypothetical protein
MSLALVASFFVGKLRDLCHGIGCTDRVLIRLLQLVFIKMKRKRVITNDRIFFFFLMNQKDYY